jgi:acetyl-CoA carboxylase carboxyltransferase component
MNGDGAVKLGYCTKFAAVEDPEARPAHFRRNTVQAYDAGKVVNAVVGDGIDDVIDPAASRSWIGIGLKRLPSVEPGTGRKRPFVDTW